VQLALDLRQTADAPRPYDVVYHGSLPPHQLEAIAGIARALAPRVPPARWAILGEPDRPGSRAEFTSALAHAGLRDRVELRPRIPFPEVPAFIAGGRTGVVPLPDLPKFRTNLPMKLFEYMAAGVPAVASDLPPARGLLDGSGAAMLVPAGDHDAFAAALADLLRHPGWAAELGARGREAVRERFHWEGEERRLVRLYARLLCGPGLRSAMEEMLA
jgi:glycosyltransferase involved in cell wall biosynthesis